MNQEIHRIKNGLMVSRDADYKDYQETVTLVVVSDGQGKTVSEKINDHNGLDETFIPNITDGWRIVYSITIPRLEAIPSELKVLHRYKRNYFYFKGAIVKYDRKNTLVDTDLSELLDDRDSNITVVRSDYFMDYNLEECLKSYVMALTEGEGLENLDIPECSDCRNMTPEQMEKARDYLNMLLNMIRHFVGCRDYASAQDTLSFAKPYCHVGKANN